MKTVLIIVLVIVAGAAVWFATTRASQEVEPPDVKFKEGSTVENLPYIDPDLSKKGVPAPGEPSWNVEVELKKDKGRNVFHFTVTEEHGWAANGVYVKLRHHGLEERTGKGMMHDRRIDILCNRSPLRFNTPLEHTVTVRDTEFPELVDFGTSENWAATVLNYSHLTAPKPSD